MPSYSYTVGTKSGKRIGTVTGYGKNRAAAHRNISRMLGRPIRAGNPEKVGKARLVKVRVPFRKSRYAWQYGGRKIMLPGSGPMVGAVDLGSGKKLDLKTGEVYRNPHRKVKRGRSG